MSDSDAARQAGDPLQDLVVHCIDALQTGGQAALESLLAGLPEHAAALRARLERLERAGLLVVEDQEPSEVPERLGEFRLVRRLGSGGMGIVYLAEQPSLGRQVALKLVRPEQRFFPGARARFRREVDAIARLGDAGIVPIYAVGDEQGIDYFTMEYVRGASLADVIAALHGSSLPRLSVRELVRVAAERAGSPAPERTPEVFAGSWTQAACRVVARMARAVHHAHERGVIHRDLKPNNAMVTPDGRVLLLDFGLAAASGATRITRTGAQIGTLHYMAPEQLTEGQVDARTDVYALGVTLHELLAFASPFPSKGSDALRNDILHGAAATLRTRGSDIPPDLATIVEVAMDKDPARRHPTAEALADDLTRFLEHRPIHARPLGRALRLKRWSQRHPASATALAFAALTVLVTPFLVRLTRDYADAEISRAERQARTNLEGAVRALEGMVASARSDLLTQTPGLDRSRLEQLDHAAQLIESIARVNTGDPVVAGLYVRGLVHVAEARHVLGQAERALEDVDRAEAVLASMDPEAVDEGDLALSRSALHSARASALVELNRFPEAAALWRRVLAAHAGTDLAAASPRLLDLLCASHHNLGRIEVSNGDLDAAQRHIDAALALDEHFQASQRDVYHVLDRCRTRLSLASLQQERGDPAAAGATLAGAHGELTALAAQHGEHPEVVRELARCDFALSRIASGEGRSTDARECRARATAALKTIVADYPDRVAYRRELGVMSFEAAQAAPDAASARALLDDALVQHSELTVRQPGQPEHATELATMLRYSARLRRGAHDEAGVLADLTRAAELQRAAVREPTGDAYYLMQLGAIEDELAALHAGAERWTETRASLRGAVDAYERAAAAQHAEALQPGALPRVLLLLAQAELMHDDLDGVVRVLGRLVEVHPISVADLKILASDLHVADHAGLAPVLAVAKRRAEERGR